MTWDPSIIWRCVKYACQAFILCTISIIWLFWSVVCIQPNLRKSEYAIKWNSGSESNFLNKMLFNMRLNIVHLTFLVCMQKLYVYVGNSWFGATIFGISKCIIWISIPSQSASHPNRDETNWMKIKNIVCFELKLLSYMIFAARELFHCIQFSMTLTLKRMLSFTQIRFVAQTPNPQTL